MEEMVTISRREYEDLKRQIVELQILVRQLEATIALLKGSKNSRTSSLAPSHVVRSNTISLRTPSGKKSGGQVGHYGHTLEMVDTPDEVIEHIPEICECCGESLANVENASFTRRQIEHRSYVKICPFCKLENRGVFPKLFKPPFSMVLWLRLW